MRKTRLPAGASLGLLLLVTLLGLATGACDKDGAAVPPTGTAASAPADPLPSWNPGATKTAILDFVSRVTREGEPRFVPPGERIAVFDNDGTLCSEQPTYFQFQFAMDRVRELAPDHPEWASQQPFKAVLRNDAEALAATGIQGMLRLVMATHTGVSPEEFARTVDGWISTARHPRFDRPYAELVYQPMLELLDYLRAKGFKTFIVSGGGVDFIRAWSEAVYGVPPDQVVGTTFKTELVMRDEEPILVHLPAVDFVDDKDGKPIAIHKFIGRRPIAAFGNSDGDLQMLQWTTAGDGERFGLLVHHTDAAREWAYDTESKVGHLDKALAQAPERGWTVVDMQRDWKVVYPFD